MAPLKSWLGTTKPAMPARDTIKIVDTGNTVLSTPDRKTVWHAQTPQSFKKEIIIKAYEKAREKGIFGTDDAGLAEAAGFKVLMFEGSIRNIKLTTAEDLMLGEYYINLSEKQYWMFTKKDKKVYEMKVNNNLHKRVYGG